MAIILYHQTIEMMSRQINLILGVVSCILLCYSNVTAQAEKSVFLIQVFKSDSTLLRDGTGFFMDGNHGYTYAFIFRNGAFCQGNHAGQLRAQCCKNTTDLILRQA